MRHSKKVESIGNNTNHIALTPDAILKTEEKNHFFQPFSQSKQNYYQRNEVPHRIQVHFNLPWTLLSQDTHNWWW